MQNIFVLSCYLCLVAFAFQFAFDSAIIGVFDETISFGNVLT